MPQTTLKNSRRRTMSPDIKTVSMTNLTWDETALYFALRIQDESIKDALPSLYLNIAKCFEDLQDIGNALKNYELALGCARSLPDDGYSNMIRGGIENGMQRVLKS
jgi:rifampin ADP-ribosylating transferase